MADSERTYCRCPWTIVCSSEFANMYRDQNPYTPQTNIADQASDSRGNERRKSILSVACNVLLIAGAMYMTIQLMANFVTILTIIPRQPTTERLVELVNSAIVQVGVTVWWWFVLTSFCSWTWYHVAPQLRRWYVAVWCMFVAGVIIDATVCVTRYGFYWRDFANLPCVEYFRFLTSYTIAAAPIVLVGIGYIGLAKRCSWFVLHLAPGKLQL